MRTVHNPIRATLFWGFICGVLFIPASLALNYLLVWSIAICLTYWLFLSGYALLMCRWSNKSFMSSVFPLLFLGLAIFQVKSIAAFFLLSLIVFSWIRSGICFPKPAGIKLLVETVYFFTGAIFLSVYIPDATFSGALGVWMFFLGQALYFILFDNSNKKTRNTYDEDPFDRACRLAEEILSNT